MAAPFKSRCPAYVERVESLLQRRLRTNIDCQTRLREAMQYSIFNGGKRLRPLLVYAAGEALGLDAGWLDGPACAVELIHCYSLVHDDLPAMDDDTLRRGRPTAHLEFDEATAILAGDALQALAFEMLATAPVPDTAPSAPAGMVGALARACGLEGMAGGQALDLAFEGQQPDRQSLEKMFQLKTGALIHSAVIMPTHLLPSLATSDRQALDDFAVHAGLAFQIRDDVLDIEGLTEEIGKKAGADEARNKATWPALFGIDQAYKRIDELAGKARSALARSNLEAEGLSWLLDRLVNRRH